jgi:aerobic carbon-monoxide dehydrogenase large subunit
MGVTTDGDLEIRVGTHSHGQGHETTFAQIAHEMTGVAFDRIKILQGDTLFAPFSTATWGSRSLVMGGGAVGEACKALVSRIVRIGASLLQADPGTVTVRNGCVQGAAGSVTLREVARAWYFEPQHLASNVDPGGLEVTAGYRAARDSGTFSYAVHAAVVAVDLETGLIQILDYAVRLAAASLLTRSTPLVHRPPRVAACGGAQAAHRWSQPRSSWRITQPLMGNSNKKPGLRSRIETT